MTRYLLFVSYLGTRFRGVQKQLSRAHPEYDDPLSVQGMLEIALKKVLRTSSKVCIASRTDAGVHALRTAVHIDIEREDGKVCESTYLIRTVNRYFDNSDIAIRVQECQIVPPTFNARYNAIKRSYLYRLAVIKPDASVLQRGKNYVAQIPFSEWRRCCFVQNPEFDVEKFKCAANLFPGERDFRTFMGKTRNNKQEVNSVRTLHSIDICPGQPLLPAHYDPAHCYYNYWDVVCSSKSFVYRQVRRMVGVLVAVAQGKLKYSDVERMLEDPSPESWSPCAAPVPAHGLYLLNVEYDPADLIVENGKVTQPLDEVEAEDILVKERTSEMG